MTKNSFAQVAQKTILALALISSTAYATGGATSGGTDSPRRCLERAQDSSEGNLQNFYANYINECASANNPGLTYCVAETLQATQSIGDTINQCAAE